MNLIEGLEELISITIKHLQNASESEEGLANLEKDLKGLDDYIQILAEKSLPNTEIDSQIPALNKPLKHETCFINSYAEAYIAGLAIQASSSPLIFGHIPKTGGSAFWHYIADNFNMLDTISGSNYSVVDAHILDSDKNLVLTNSQDILGESEMIRVNHLINTCPGRPVIHAHFCGMNISPIIPSTTILFYRDPAQRLKSAFKEYSRNKQNDDNRDCNEFWKAPFGRSIKPWLSSKYLSHGGQRYIFNFDELSKSKGHLQALFLGLDLPCKKISVYEETVTHGIENLEVSLQQALKDKKFEEIFKKMVVEEENMWETAGIPAEWL